MSKDLWKWNVVNRYADSIYYRISSSDFARMYACIRVVGFEGVSGTPVDAYIHINGSSQVKLLYPNYDAIGDRVQFYYSGLDIYLMVPSGSQMYAKIESYGGGVNIDNAVTLPTDAVRLAP